MALTKSVTSRSSQVTDMIRSGPGASGTLQDFMSDQFSLDSVVTQQHAHLIVAL